MNVDPEDLVRDLAHRAHDLTALPPPRLLEHGAEPPAPLDDTRTLPQIVGLHEHWANVHSEQARPGGAGGVRAKVRARVAAAATEATRADRQDDRALVGDLIRAVDMLASRSDELAHRLDHLQAVLTELIAAFGDDVVRLRASLARPPAPQGLPHDELGGSDHRSPDAAV